MPTQKNFSIIKAAVPSDNQKQNGWDLLVERFNLHKETQQIHPDAAVNIFVGWPILLEKIDYHKKTLNKNKLDILDFGCGTGGFLKKLSSLEHTVVGADKSTQMLDTARQNLGNSLNLITTEELFSEKKDFEEKFDAIVSIHSLEWIEDIEDVLNKLTKIIRKNGMFIFAVFPKEHVIDSLKIEDLFEDFDSCENPTRGNANFDGVKIPVYIRGCEFFDGLLEKLNFEKVSEDYPGYPKKFLEKYGWQGSKYPEMVILSYKKL